MINPFVSIRTKTIFPFIVFFILFIAGISAIFFIREDITRIRQFRNEIDIPLRELSYEVALLDYHITATADQLTERAFHNKTQEVLLLEQEYELLLKELSEKFSTALRLLQNSNRNAALKRQSAELILRLMEINDKLILIERQAIIFAKQQKAQNAHELMTSQEYLVLKRQYYESYIRWNKIEQEVTAQSRLQVDRELELILYLITGLFITAAITVILHTFVLRRTLLRPIYAIEKTAVQWARGNYARINLRTGDEFEKIAHTMNKTSALLYELEVRRTTLDEAKKRFLQIVSHEMRSPMTPALAELQMLQKNYYGTLHKKQRTAIERIANNTKRLDKLIEDFLEINRIESGRLKFDFRPTQINKLITSVAESMKLYAPNKKITIKTKLSPETTITCDPERISQIITNLLSNAIKYSPPKTTVLISSRQIDGKIHISVQDQGEGISPENLKKLFQPFFRINPEKHPGGTGLGLAIAKGLVIAHGGWIWAESKLGKGTTFYFTIPKKAV